MMQILEDGVLRPATPEEVAQAEIDALKYQEEGNKAPTVVTARQARLALLQAGKLAAVAPAIAALPSPQKEAAQIEWEYSTEVKRDSALVTQLAPALGLDAAALDALFTQAATL